MSRKFLAIGLIVGLLTGLPTGYFLLSMLSNWSGHIEILNQKIVCSTAVFSSWQNSRMHKSLEVLKVTQNPL